MSMARDALIVKALNGEAQTPLQIILSVMGGNTEITALQLKAAELAAPYVHPKLIAVRAKTEITGANGEPLTLGGVADPVEAARIYARIMSQQVTIEHEAAVEAAIEEAEK